MILRAPPLITRPLTRTQLNWEYLSRSSGMAKWALTSVSVVRVRAVAAAAPTFPPTLNRTDSIMDCEGFLQDGKRCPNQKFFSHQEND